MSPLRVVRVVAVTLIAALPSLAAAQGATVNDYVVTSWTETDGLWASYIRAIGQDRHGYLWLGTENGLMRFDGVRFVRFEGRGDAELPERPVVNLCVGRDTSLWVGFGIGGGISQITDGRITNHPVNDGFVNGCAEDRQGNLWVGTRGGLHRSSNGRWERWGAERGVPAGRIFALYADRAGTVWIASAAGVHRLRAGEQAFEAVNETIPLPMSFAESADGTVWIADRERGVISLGEGPRRAPAVTVPDAGIYEILHDTRGNLWIATLDRGLWLARRTDNGYAAAVPLTGKNLLPSDSVYALFEDREHNVWASTPIGLHKFSTRRLTAVADLGVVRAVEADRDGTVWVATPDGLGQLSATGRRWFGRRDGLPSSNIRALHIDPAGVLWVATDVGISRLAGGRFHDVGRLPNSVVTTIASDGRGTLWIRDVNLGLLRWTATGGHTFDPAPTVHHTSVDLVSADREGRIWVAITGGGIGVAHPGGSFEVLRAPAPDNPSTLAMHDDGAGNMWFGGGPRLFRVTDGRIRSSARIDTGFSGDVILSIVNDRQGDLWLAMTSGIVHVRRADFEAAAAAQSHATNVRHYGSSDGAAGLPIRIGYPSKARALDGRLWFVTANGLTIVDPTHLTNGPPPPVRIERLVVNGRAADGEGEISLPPNPSSVQIDYGAPTFVSPERVQFRYRLEGQEREWVQAGDRREAFYANLPAGTYRFHVSARSAEGVWTSNAATLAFSVQPTFYQTGWFYAVCSLVGLLSVVAAWQFRLRQVRREFSLVLAERVRLSREIHDTLLQSLVGVALGLDASCTRLGPAASSERSHLLRLREQVTAHIRDARQRIWNLRSPALAHHDLASAIRETAARALEDTAIQYELIVTGEPQRCAANVEEQLLSICQEAFVNAVHHAQATNVLVRLEYSPHSIHLVVSDNGRGFDPRPRVGNAGAHCGLLIMQERAEQVGGRFLLQTRRGQGTTIDVVVPFALAERSESDVA